MRRHAARAFVSAFATTVCLAGCSANLVVGTRAQDAAVDPQRDAGSVGDAQATPLMDAGAARDALAPTRPDANTNDEMQCDDDGECRARRIPCTSALQCAGNDDRVCHPTLQVCVECVSDDDCPPNATCESDHECDD